MEPDKVTGVLVSDVACRRVVEPVEETTRWALRPEPGCFNALVGRGASDEEIAAALATSRVMTAGCTEQHPAEELPMQTCRTECLAFSRASRRRCV
jgi:hypothetical protein